MTAIEKEKLPIAAEIVDEDIETENQSNFFLVYMKDTWAAIKPCADECKKKQETDGRLLLTLQTRALACYILISLVRIYLIIIDKGDWIEEQLQCKNDGIIDDCFGKHNEQLFAVTAAPARWTVKMLIIIGAFVCIFACRWRRLASLCIYIEMLIRITAILLPNSRIYHSDANTFTLELIAFGSTLSTGDKYSAWLVIVTFTWQLLGAHLFYLRPLGIGMILYLILRIVLFMMAFSLIISSIYYITKLHD